MKTPGEILRIGMNAYFGEMEKDNLSDKSFLGGKFFGVLVSCHKCYQGEEGQMEKVRTGLNTDFSYSKRHVDAAENFCEICEDYKKPIPSILTFTARTIEMISDS